MYRESNGKLYSQEDVERVCEFIRKEYRLDWSEYYPKYFPKRKRLIARLKKRYPKEKPLFSLFDRLKSSWNSFPIGLQHFMWPWLKMSE